MLQTYDSVLLPGSAIYSSAPITSGRRYLEWLAHRRGARDGIDDLTEADRHQHRVQVIEPNRQHAKAVADRLRARTKKPVIDPTAVGPIEGWRQTDWIGFWEEVIARFSCEIVLIDGWEYSYGCTHEFWFAHSRSIPTRDESGNEIAPANGVELIRCAARDLKLAGGDAGKLERVLHLLQRIRA